MDWDYIIKVYIMELGYGILMFILGYKTKKAIKKARKK